MRRATLAHMPLKHLGGEDYRVDEDAVKRYVEEGVFVIVPNERGVKEMFISDDCNILLGTVTS